MGTVRRTVPIDPNVDKLLQRNQTLAAQKNVSFTDLLITASFSKKETKKQRSL